MALAEPHLRLLTDGERRALEAEYPNARRELERMLFISHAGRDTPAIRRDVLPALSELYRDVFLHNRFSGGSEAYKHLIELALHLCPRFLLVISQNVVGHPWVLAEIDWALAQDRDFVCCRLDDTLPSEVHSGLA